MNYTGEKFAGTDHMTNEHILSLTFCKYTVL